MRTLVLPRVVGALVLPKVLRPLLPGIIRALIPVDAEGSRVVELEPSRAHALEAAVSVLAGSRRGTQTLQNYDI